MQIYQNFYIARANLIFSSENINYGNLCSMLGINKDSLQKIYLQNALLYYNFCIDLSWTLSYFYCLPHKEEFNISTDEIEKGEKAINYQFVNDYLNAQLKMVYNNQKYKIERLIKIITGFWTQILEDDFRETYNYIKHQGAFNILDINLPDFFKIEGITPNINIIKSREFDMEKITNMLIKFNNDFIAYMDKIIEIVIDKTNTKEIYDFKEIVSNIVKKPAQDNRK